MAASVLYRPLASRRLVHRRYHVYSEVGSRVRLAQDVLMHRPVALKYVGSAEAAEREASLLGIVGPETAPELYETFVDPTASGAEQHVLVMEAADSLSAGLERFCCKRREGLPARSHALRLITCVLALHDRQLVHCDLKTKHFLRFHGEWKLVDYGSVLDEGTERLGPPCTVRFAAPEVAAARQRSRPLRGP